MPEKETLHNSAHIIIESSGEENDTLIETNSAHTRSTTDTNKQTSHTGDRTNATQEKSTILTITIESSETETKQPEEEISENVENAEISENREISKNREIPENREISEEEDTSKKRKISTTSEKMTEITTSPEKSPMEKSTLEKKPTTLENSDKNDPMLTLRENVSIAFDLDKEIDDVINELEEIASPVNDRQNTNIPSTQCLHSVRIGDLCAFCGIELPSDNTLVNVIHSSDQIRQSFEFAFKTAVDHFYDLYAKKKLILLCDLDQTLIHASLDQSVPCDFQFSLDGVPFYVKKRHNLDSFLEHLHNRYELHVYTMGTRAYANGICAHIDPKNKYFKDRIVTRTENNNELKKYIKRITSYEKNVLALDDRIDVWNFIPNVIMVKPFHYFNNTDINEPSKIQKRTNAESGSNVESGSNITDTVNFLDVAIDSLNTQGREEMNEICSKALSDIMREDINMGIDEITKASGDTNKNTKDISTEKEQTVPDEFVYKEEFTTQDDYELENAYVTLKQIHTDYFTAMKKLVGKGRGIRSLPLDDLLDISDICKLTILEDMSFLCRTKYYNHVKFTGGKIKKIREEITDKENTYTIEDKEIAEKYGIISIKEGYLIDCITQRMKLPLEEYIQE